MRSALIFLSLVLAGLAAAQEVAAPETSEYRNSELGLALSHPRAWKVATDKKGLTRITFAAGTNGDTAVVELFAIDFFRSAEDWQLLQAQVLKQTQRELIKQWQEEILGVPFLLTRSMHVTDGREVASLIGLLYTRTNRKLLLKVAAPSEAYEDVEFTLRSVMESLRTLDGSLPLPENPDRRLEPEVNAKPATRPPKVTRIEPPKSAVTVKKGDQAIDLVAGGKKVQLRFGAGWTAKAGESGWTFTHPELEAPIHVEVHSVLDSDTPVKALFKLSSTSLKQFSKVLKREETLPLPNTAGARMSIIWRTGSSAQGDLATCEAAGLLEDHYWLASYRHAGPLSAGQRKLVESLLSGMSVELAP